MFLIVFSLFAKKDVKDVASWKIILYFFLSLPLMLLLSFVLIIVFAISVVSYIFLTSWFIFYGAYLSSRRIDDSLKKKNHSKTLRSLEFFGGIALSLLLLNLYVKYSYEIGGLIGTNVSALIDYSNLILYIIEALIISATIVTIVYLVKKIFIAWLGIFNIYLVFYIFYLLAKLFLAFRSYTSISTSSSLISDIILYLVDCSILLYSISTLIGSQASILWEKLRERGLIRSKRIFIDTIILWLVFSKVAYEFIHNFPYNILTELEIWFPSLTYISFLDSATVNLLKNIGVLVFLLLILISSGIYEIRRYILEEKEFIKEVDEDVDKLIGKKAIIKEIIPMPEKEQDEPKEIKSDEDNSEI